MARDRGDRQLDELLGLVEEQLQLSRRIVHRLDGHDALSVEVLRTQTLFDQVEAALGEARGALLAHPSRPAPQHPDTATADGT